MTSPLSLSKDDTAMARIIADEGEHVAHNYHPLPVAAVSVAVVSAVVVSVTVPCVIGAAPACST